MPAYHCRTAVEPVRHCGGAIRFYNVRRDCTVDPADVRARLSVRTRALFVIHYFGFPQPLGPLVALCRQHGLRLIEDCAHVLVGAADGVPLGATGDIAVFSWRKFLPIYDGGQLVVNDPRCTLHVPWSRYTLAARARNLQDGLERLANDSESRILRRAPAAARRLLGGARRLLRPSASSASAVAVDSTSEEFDPRHVNVAISPFSRRVLRRSDLSEVVRRRRASYERLQAALAPLAAIRPLFPALPPEGCPWVFPLLAPATPDLNRLLRQEGIPSFTWEGVIDPALPLADFPDADYLYHNLVLLPAHQDLTEREIGLLSATIGRVVASAVGSSHV
jgi:dTDP-4-amino-4,6-dideoxygalactose transaminase